MARPSKAPVLQLDASQREQAGAMLKRFLDERFELQVGAFEALEVLDWVLGEYGALLYNQAISDVQAHLKDRFESIESDLWALEKS